jgi:hypothetical protein
VLPGLSLEGNEVMWSGEPPPVSGCRIDFCDGGSIETGLVPLSGLAMTAYVSEDFGGRTIRRAEADGEGFTLSAERVCPIPATPTAEIACTLEAVYEYVATITPMITTSNDDLRQYVSLLNAETWDEKAYRAIANRHMPIQSQLNSMNVPACLAEVHEETLAAMWYRFSAYNAIAGLPRPNYARLHEWVDEVNDFVDQSESHMHRAGDLMAALLLERFGIPATPTP